MKRLIQRMIIAGVEIAITIVCSLLLLAAMPWLLAMIVYDWAKGAELTDIDEVIKPKKPKPVYTDDLEARLERKRLVGR